ncbi:MAG TPA: DinB family protein [Bryobacteraceae bacterium]|jgi:uncharacterized damage-inducible protein DinB|nr:DinB family protein [Bryobacteraceae bacterium]
MSVESLFLESAAETLLEHLGRIETCVAKLTEDQIWARGQENENAIGNLALHLTGNVRQWIISGLGGEPDSRFRDAEFNARQGPAAAVLTANLRAAVERAIEVIRHLNTEQLTSVHEIQKYKVTGVYAVLHVVEHFAQHTAQIIFGTKMLTGSDLGFYRHLNTNSQSA